MCLKTNKFLILNLLLTVVGDTRGGIEGAEFVHFPNKNNKTKKMLF